MKIIGLTRIRNEEYIIQDTLNHLALFCTGGIVIYDDASTDNTVEICRKHSSVIGIIEGKTHDTNRERAEFMNRQELLELAQRNSTIDDWFVYIDADERLEFDWGCLDKIDKNILGIKMRLFDFYITSEDIHLHYSKRRKLGPEYRDILFIFRNSSCLKYRKNDQREVDLGQPGKMLQKGYVRHYGKAISIEQREETCEYYAKKFPKYSSKWNIRRGKAVHTLSDFGSHLITWDQKEEKGFPLFLVQKNYFSFSWRGEFLSYLKRKWLKN